MLSAQPDDVALESPAYSYVRDCFAGRIPVISSPIILKPGETAYYSSPVSVLEQKTQTTTHRRYVGTRVKIGSVPLYFGGSSPIKESREVISAVGQGLLTVTNLRINLNGAKINYSIPLDSLTDWRMFSDGIQLFNDGARGGRFYLIDDPWRVAVILAAELKMKRLGLSLPDGPFTALKPSDQQVIRQILTARERITTEAARSRRHEIWFESRLAVVAWLLLVPPVGFYALWVTQRITLGIKIFLFFVGLVALGKWLAFFRG
jgi:hypothetical protein